MKFSNTKTPTLFTAVLRELPAPRDIPACDRGPEDPLDTTPDASMLCNCSISAFFFDNSVCSCFTVSSSRISRSRELLAGRGDDLSFPVYGDFCTDCSR